MSIAVLDWRRTLETGGSKPPQKTKRSMPPSGEVSSNMVRNVAEFRSANASSTRRGFRCCERREDAHEFPRI